MGKSRLEELEVGCVESHFLDSGAFTLWTRASAWAAEQGLPDSRKFDFYETDEAWDYIDSYASFVKKHAAGIDLYANVDVIPNPELTWRNQRYLEKKHGLSPVPVVHYTTDLEWLQHYIDKEYELIGLGGLVGSTNQESCRDWLDRAFDLVCSNPKRLPCVKLHGFGVTSYPLLIRYPWWSVDSTSWTKVGAYGGILVPHRRQGKYTFLEDPYVMKVSDESPDKSKAGRHIHSLSQAEQQIVLAWLKHIDIPYGKVNAEGEILVYGVTNRHSERKAANLLFFEEMRKSLPDYPWQFLLQPRSSFGLTK